MIARVKELYCIICPTGCRLVVTENNGEFAVEGNECKRGADFAKAEMVNPMRSLTTTVRTSLPSVPVLPVRTDGEIPKDKITEAMHVLSGIVINCELDCGDTVLENVVGCGVRVIATSDLLSSNGKWKIENGRLEDEGNEVYTQVLDSGENGNIAGEIQPDVTESDTTTQPEGEKTPRQRVSPLRT